MSKSKRQSVTMARTETKHFRHLVDVVKEQEAKKEVKEQK